VALPPALQPVVESPASCALFVDFDGSLAPIVPDPASARVLPAARAALARVAPHLGRVAVVSGRTAEFLMAAVDVGGVEHVGAYGLERVVGGVVVVDSRAAPFLDAVAQAAREAHSAFPDLLVESKGEVAVTLHWRSQPGRGTEVIEWAEAAAARLGLDAPLRGRMAVELRPPVPVDKGTSVVDLARGMTTAVFAGDDAGDVPAFDALHVLVDAGVLAHGVSIGVCSDESPAAINAADVVVDGPTGLAALLDELADALSGRG